MILTGVTLPTQTQTEATQCVATWWASRKGPSHVKGGMNIRSGLNLLQVRTIEGTSINPFSHHCAPMPWSVSMRHCLLKVPSPQHCYSEDHAPSTWAFR